MRWGKDRQKTVVPAPPEEKAAASLKKVIPERTWGNGEVIEGLYEVKDNSLKGGMGRVYIVEHLRWQILLAVKYPLGHIFADERRRLRFIREAQVWVDLGLHSHIATCFYVRQIEGVPCIFIEYVDGGTLEQWIRDGKFKEWEDILDVAIQFCQGMSYAHGCGLIHRDIKPANCLMTKDRVLKITDFGIVKMMEELTEWETNNDKNIFPKDEGLTMGMIGTPEYMAPEQFGYAKPVGREADIYSFGVMLFELCCGQRPFLMSSEDPRPREIAYRVMHLTEKPPNPKALRPDMSDRLRDLILECLEKEPEDRQHLSFVVLIDRLRLLYEDSVEKPYELLSVDKMTLRADSLNNQALSYLDLSMERNAMACWQKAAKADPQHLETVFNLGYCEWQRARITDDVYLERILNLENVHGSSPKYWHGLGLVQSERGAFSAAVEAVKIAKGLGYSKNDLRPLIQEFFSSKGEVRTIPGHGGNVNSVAISENCRYALSGSGDCTVRLWDIKEDKPINVLKGHNYDVFSVAFSPDGRYALSGGGDNTVRLWDISEGTYIKVLEGHTKGVFSVAFSPDGRYALSGGGDNTVRLWDIAEERHIKILDGHDGAVLSVGFSSDGDYILSGSMDGDLRLWGMYEEACIGVFKGHTKEITSVTFSRDGLHFLSASGDKTIRLWKTGRRECLRTFEGHREKVNCVAFSPDSRYILSGGDDETLRLWDAAKGRCLRTFEGHADRVLCGVISSDGKSAMSGAANGTIRLWNIDRKGSTSFPYFLCKPKGVKETLITETNAKYMLTEARRLIDKKDYSGSYSILCKCRQIQGFERASEILDMISVCGLKAEKGRDFKDVWHVKGFEGHGGWITSVAFSYDSIHFISASRDKTVRIWDLKEGGSIKVLEGHTDIVSSVEVSPDAKYALSGSRDGTLRLWDLVDGKCVKVLRGHRGWVNTIAFSSDGHCVVSGSSDKSLRIWDLKKSTCIRIIEGHRDEVDSVVFSHDGRYVFSGSKDGTLRLWNIDRRKCLNVFEDYMGCMALSPDSRHVLFARRHMGLALWSVETGSRVDIYDVELGHTNSAAFSRDGKYIICGDNDGKLKLWKVGGSACLKLLEGHTDSVLSVAFSMDGRYVLSGSKDNTLRLWEIEWDWNFPEATGLDERAIPSRSAQDIFDPELRA